MGVNIFYFTGTGNSLAIARDIAQKLNGTLIPIKTVADEEVIRTDAEVIGIVYPVYNQIVPFIVKRFIEKIDTIQSRYLFAVCTYGGSPGLSLEYLDELIKQKGSSLARGFAVKMPYNYVSPSLVFKNFYRSFKLRETPFKKQQDLFSNWKSRIDEVCLCIEKRERGRLETQDEVIERMICSLNLRETWQKSSWLKIGGYNEKSDLPFIESIQLLDYGFTTDDNCKGCGICTKICPAENIKMEDGHLQWQHKCEQCFACLNWCPSAAIQFSSKTPGQKRYHHPDVCLSEMITKE